MKKRALHTPQEEKGLTEFEYTVAGVLIFVITVAAFQVLAQLVCGIGGCA